MVIRRVVLLGFMGSGKSTVGARLAGRLGWGHVDLDAEIERAEGRSVAEIFAVDGEAHFRRREAELTLELAGRDRVVWSPGGGWITRPELLRALGSGTLSAWLQVSPDEAWRRTRGAVETRPLLHAAADPLAAIQARLREREPLYRRADLHIPTDHRAPDEIVAELERRLAGRTG